MPGLHYMFLAALEPRSGALQRPALHLEAIASTLYPHNPPQIGLTYSEIADKAPRRQVIGCHGDPSNRPGKLEHHLIGGGCG